MPLPEIQQMYQNVFASFEGRRVLGDICELCHVFDPVDPMDTARQSERNVGLIILQMTGVLNPLYTQLGIAKETEDASEPPVL